MASRNLTIVLCYDISRARPRRKVAKLLEERMVRVQKSVFEAQITADAANHLFDMAASLLGQDDSLRMYVMTRSGLGKSRVAGGAPLPEDGAYWLL